MPQKLLIVESSLQLNALKQDHEIKYGIVSNRLFLQQTSFIVKSFLSKAENIDKSKWWLTDWVFQLQMMAVWTG